MSTNLEMSPGALPFVTTGRCPTCGFDPAGITPDGAAAILRAAPTDWRKALTLRLDDSDPAERLVTRRRPGEWTAVEHAGHVRDVLHALDIRVQRVLREDEPVLPETHVTPPAGANEQGVAVVLAALQVSADQFTQTIEITPTAAWTRTARRAGQALCALDLLREAGHESAHHLYLANIASGQAQSAIAL